MKARKKPITNVVITPRLETLVFPGYIAIILHPISRADRAPRSTPARTHRGAIIPTRIAAPFINIRCFPRTKRPRGTLYTRSRHQKKPDEFSIEPKLVKADDRPMKKRKSLSVGSREGGQSESSRRGLKNEEKTRAINAIFYKSRASERWRAI